MRPFQKVPDLQLTGEGVCAMWLHLRGECAIINGFGEILRDILCDQLAVENYRGLTFYEVESAVL